jgi:predicted RNase H-like HicB family nuclease
VNKQAIQSTTIAYWCDEDKCFIVQSPLMDSIIGAGETEEEARREFNDILSDAYEAYLEGRMSGERPGRPAKNRTALNTDVMPTTRETIKMMAERFSCSQGEVIDFLLAFHDRFSDAGDSLRVSETASSYSVGRLKSKDKRKSLQGIERRVAAIEAALQKRSK